MSSLVRQDEFDDEVVVVVADGVGVVVVVVVGIEVGVVVVVADGVGVVVVVEFVVGIEVGVVVRVEVVVVVEFVVEFVVGIEVGIEVRVEVGIGVGIGGDGLGPGCARGRGRCPGRAAMTEHSEHCLREAAAAVVALHFDGQFTRTGSVLSTLRRISPEHAAVVRSAGDLAAERAGLPTSSPEDGSRFARSVVERCWPGILALSAELERSGSMTRKSVELYLTLHELGVRS